jgi:hypothetical protein
MPGARRSRPITIFMPVLLIFLLSVPILVQAETTTTKGGIPPVQTRVVRLRALNDFSSWAAAGYNAQQILGMIGDLQPTMLHRYISGPQDPAAFVPVCQTCDPMTVAQFLQASEGVDGATIVARLSLNDYDSGALLPEAQALRNIPISPRLTWLSLDDYGGWSQNHNSSQFVSLVDDLFAQGWTNLEAGGCGSHAGIPDGSTNFASACYRNPDWVVSQASVASWTSYHSIRFVLAVPDFPGDIAILESMGGSAREAGIFSDLAGNQSQLGYSLVYPILQGDWDSKNVTIIAGPYSGSTLYGEMKDLMNRFNPLTTGTTSTTTSLSTRTTSTTTSQSKSTTFTTTFGSTGTTYTTTMRSTDTTLRTTSLSTATTASSAESTDNVASSVGSSGYDNYLLATVVVVLLVGVASSWGGVRRMVRMARTGTSREKAEE